MVLTTQDPALPTWSTRKYLKSAWAVRRMVTTLPGYECACLAHMQFSYY